jgi:hypothetical protein
MGQILYPVSGRVDRRQSAAAINGGTRPMGPVRAGKSFHGPQSRTTEWRIRHDFGNRPRRFLQGLRLPEGYGSGHIRASERARDGV